MNETVTTTAYPPVSSTLATPAKVVPLLQALSRAEDLVSALALRLDPIVSHSPTAENAQKMTTNTVTGRLHQLGDTLQYLLDNSEL